MAAIDQIVEAVKAANLTDAEVVTLAEKLAADRVVVIGYSRDDVEERLQYARRDADLTLSDDQWDAVCGTDQWQDLYENLADYAADLIKDAFFAADLMGD